MSHIVFISYSRSDSALAKRVVHRLATQGITVWVDETSIGSGMRWDEEVQSAIANCQLFVVMMSKQSVRSNIVLDEVHVALEKGKLIIPLLVEECEVPLRLSRIQYIDLRHDEKLALSRLIDRVSNKLDGSDGPLPKYNSTKSKHNQVVTDELHRWIAEQIRAGCIAEVIVQAMKTAGWDEDLARTTFENSARASGSGLAQAESVKEVCASDEHTSSSAGDKSLPKTGKTVTEELRRWIVVQIAAGCVAEDIVQAMQISGWDEDTAREAYVQALRVSK